MFNSYEVDDYKLRRIIEDAVKTYKIFSDEQKNLDRFLFLCDVHQNFDNFVSEIEEAIEKYKLYKDSKTHSFDFLLDRIEAIDHNIAHREIYGILDKDKDSIEHELRKYREYKEILKIKNLPRHEFASNYSRYAEIAKNANKLIREREKLIQETRAEYEENIKFYTEERIAQAKKIIQSEKSDFSTYIPGRRSKLYSVMGDLETYIYQEKENTDRFFVKNFQKFLEDNYSSRWTYDKKFFTYTRDRYVVENYISKIASGEISIKEDQGEGEKV